MARNADALTLVRSVPRLVCDLFLQLVYDKIICVSTGCQNNKVKEYSIRRRSRASDELHLSDGMYKDQVTSNTQINKTGGVENLHSSEHASTSGESTVVNLWIKMNLRWKKMYPWLPAMNHPSDEGVKGTHTPKGSGPEQQLTGTRKLYSLWLRALAFLDVSATARNSCIIHFDPIRNVQCAALQDDSLLTCCLVSKHMATLSLNPRLWFMSGDNTKNEQSKSLASTKLNKKQTDKAKPEMTSGDNQMKALDTVHPGWVPHGVPVMAL